MKYIKLAAVTMLSFIIVACNDDAVKSTDVALCSQQWYSLVEKKVVTGDGKGHGPDLGSTEWRSVVEFKLGIRGDPNVPIIESKQWCEYINEQLIKIKT